MLFVIISGESEEEKHHHKEENEKAAKGERFIQTFLYVVMFEVNASGE